LTKLLGIIEEQEQKYVYALSSVVKKSNRSNLAQNFISYKSMELALSSTSVSTLFMKAID